MGCWHIPVTSASITAQGCCLLALLCFSLPYGPVPSSVHGSSGNVLTFGRNWFHIVPHNSWVVCFLQLPELSCRALQLLESLDLSGRRRPVYLTLLLPQIGIFSIKKPVGVSGHQALTAAETTTRVPCIQRAAWWQGASRETKRLPVPV